jgi:hypothetical protein
MKTWTAIVSLGVIAGFAASAVADDRHHDNNNRKRVFRAQLVGLNEVPSVSTAARGQFYAIANQAGTELTYWLSFSDLSGDVTQSHIHFGQHHTNGGISVWLCEGSLAAPTPSTPSCGGPRSTAQGIASRPGGPLANHRQRSATLAAPEGAAIYLFEISP